MNYDLDPLLQHSAALESPSRFLDIAAPSPGLWPWNLSSSSGPLTPSEGAVAAAFSFPTPAFLAAASQGPAVSRGEANPFEFSFASGGHGSKLREDITATLAQEAEEVAHVSEQQQERAAFRGALPPMPGGRKRALSSPAIFDFSTWTTSPGGAVDIREPKKQRTEPSLLSVALTPASGSDASDSPHSHSSTASTALTPPDSVAADDDRRMHKSFSNEFAPAVNKTMSPAQLLRSLPASHTQPPSTEMGIAPLATTTGQYAPVVVAPIPVRSAFGTDLSYAPAQSMPPPPPPMPIGGEGAQELNPWEFATVPLPVAGGQLEHRGNTGGRYESFRMEGLSVLPFDAPDRPLSGVAQQSSAGKKEEPKKGKGKKGKGNKAGAEQEEEAVDEEEEKRRVFLERNRVAACRSRQKKKERVGALEQTAADLSASNLELQRQARALQNELLSLRAHLSSHNGCNCTHVLGYLSREQNGGGIPMIQEIAGPTLSRDFEKAPRMGSTDDCYAGMGDIIPAPPKTKAVTPALQAKPAAVKPLPVATHPAPSNMVKMEEHDSSLQQQQQQQSRPHYGTRSSARKTHQLGSTYQPAELNDLVVSQPMWQPEGAYDLPLSVAV